MVAQRWARAAIASVIAVAPAVGARGQVTVTVSAPATVTARVPALVRVEVTAPAAATVRITPPAFAPMRLVRTDRAPTDTAGLGGRQRLDWRFVLRSDGAGTFAFDPFEVDVQGTGLRTATFRSRPWSMSVLPGPATLSGASVPAITGAAAADVDPSRLSFDAAVAPARVYVGQQATLELRVGIGVRVRERLRRSPEFAFPSVGGVVTYDLTSRHASTPGADVHVYRRALFPLAAGVVSVPAAQLAYALTPEGDPFGAEERVATRSDARQFVAVAPPLAARPATWGGAVGRYRASARVDTAHARVGDAIVYTLRVAGTGNVMLLPRPALAVSWAEASPAGERVTIDSTGDLAGGAKEFDWLLTPHAAGPQRVPAVGYAYFDPSAATYAVTDAPAIDLRVLPGSFGPARPTSAAGAGAGAGGSVPTGLGVRRTFDAERGPSLVDRRAFWLALASVPVPGAFWLLAAATLTRWRRRRMQRTRTAAPGSARARATSALAEFASGLGSLIGVAPLALGDGRTLARTLRRAGISRALADECDHAIDRWRRAAYDTNDRADVHAGDDATTLRTLLQRVARELDDARARPPKREGDSAPYESVAPLRLPRHMWPGLALAVAVLAIGGATPQLTAHRGDVPAGGDRAHAASAFAAGVDAYAAGDAGRARDLFLAAADAVPRSPTTWLNAGTAAWAVGDTATAAFAWQRAAHLAPTLAGVRARLERLPAVAGPGRVGAPPITDATLIAVAAVTVAALAALWMLASAVAYTRAASVGLASTFPSRGPLVAYVAAVALAATTTAAARATEVRGLAVVRAPVALRPEPVLEASPDAMVATGEVARVEADEGEWVRVQLDGGREGWVRAAQLAPLDGSP